MPVAVNHNGWSRLRLQNAHTDFAAGRQGWAVRQFLIKGDSDSEMHFFAREVIKRRCRVHSLIADFRRQLLNLPIVAASQMMEKIAAIVERRQNAVGFLIADDMSCSVDEPSSSVREFCHTINKRHALGVVRTNGHNQSSTVGTSRMD